MSNSPLVDYVKISPNKTSPRSHEIDTITIHCYVGQVTAKQGCDYFATTKRQCSANYIVGTDGSIGLSVEEKDRSWASSNAGNDNRAITIEVASDKVYPYVVNDKAYASLIELLADICKRNGIKELKWHGNKSLVGDVDRQNMTVHRWFSATECPGDYLYTRMGSIATEVNTRLKGSDNMDVNEFAKLFIEYRGTLQDNDSDEYSKEAREWSLSTGLIQGSGKDENGDPNGMWKDFLTREQLVTVLYRFAKMIEKA